MRLKGRLPDILVYHLPYMCRNLGNSFRFGEEKSEQLTAEY
jgi:hypothetical protein